MKLSLQEMTSLINQCQQLHSQGKGGEEILSFLRSQGCSKVQSIMALKEAFGFESLKAKKLVHFSKAWADSRHHDERFHESLHKTFDEKND